MMWKRHVTGPPVEIVDVIPIPRSFREVEITRRPAAAAALTAPQRERLALALHERWHAPCATTHGEVRCAEIAGCFDDVAALEPEILALMRGGL